MKAEREFNPSVAQLGTHVDGSQFIVHWVRCPKCATHVAVKSVFATRDYSAQDTYDFDCPTCRFPMRTLA